MATTALRQRMLEDLQLRGLSARTQECDRQRRRESRPNWPVWNS